MKIKKILIFGATSAIVSETAKLFAREGASLYLCSRRQEDLQRLAADLKVRGAQEVFYATFDASQFGSWCQAITDCLSKFSELDGLLIGHGILPDKTQCESQPEVLHQAMAVNFTSIVAILSQIVPYFEQQRCGRIAVISSVAGDRGRQSNYVYGAAKSGLDAFLSGLRQRLFAAGVSVTTIKPGFVDTPMTIDFDKNFLWASPQKIGNGIYRAMQNGKAVVYLPGFWQGIMLVIRSIPESLFKRLRL